MLNQMKAMARPYATLFAIALVVAVLARIGLAVMDATGSLAYDYISATGVPMLDVVCSILTGSAFVAFLFAAALALTLSTAGVALYAALGRREDVRAHPGTAFFWGWATALVAMICLVTAGKWADEEMERAAHAAATKAGKPPEETKEEGQVDGCGNETM